MSERTIPGSNVPPTSAEWAVFSELGLFYHGRENALALKSIRIRTGMSEREIKKAVQGLRLRHRVRIGSTRGRRGLPTGYFIVESVEDRDAAAQPYNRQIVNMARVSRAIYGNDREFKAWLGQLELEVCK
jgi:hypothetical protein